MLSGVGHGLAADVLLTGSIDLGEGCLDKRNVHRWARWAGEHTAMIKQATFLDADGRLRRAEVWEFVSGCFVYFDAFWRCLRPVQWLLPLLLLTIAVAGCEPTYYRGIQ